MDRSGSQRKLISSYFRRTLIPLGLFFSLASFILTKKSFRVFDSNSGKQVQISSIVSSHDSISVYVFGEEHDDSVAHILQLNLLKALHDKYKNQVVLSLEMFDRDVQHIMNDYLKGLLKKNYFLQDARVWSNYEDYAPLVEYAKANQLEVICANAPFRYANLVSRLGMDSLNQVSNETKHFLPPIPYKNPSVAYRNKIESLLGDHAKPDSSGYDLLRGQALWNASMAYWISEKIKTKPEAKILHINGRLHSDNKLGLLEHLEYYQVPREKCLTFSSVKVEKLPKKVNKKDFYRADFLIFTSK